MCQRRKLRKILSMIQGHMGRKSTMPISDLVGVAMTLRTLLTKLKSRGNSITQATEIANRTVVLSLNYLTMAIRSLAEGRANLEEKIGYIITSKEQVLNETLQDLLKVALENQ